MIDKLLKEALSEGIETSAELIAYLLALDKFRPYPSPIRPIDLVVGGALPLAIDKLIDLGLFRKAIGSSGPGVVPIYKHDSVFNDERFIFLVSVIKNITSFTNEDRLIVWLCLIDEDVFKYGYDSIDVYETQRRYSNSTFVESEDDLTYSPTGRLIKTLLQAADKNSNMTPFGLTFFKLLTWAGVKNIQSISTAILIGVIQQHPKGLTRSEVDIELSKVCYSIHNLGARIKRLVEAEEFVFVDEQKRDGQTVYKATGCPINPYPLRYHFDTLHIEGISNVRELMLVYVLGIVEVTAVIQVTSFFKQYFGLYVDASFVKRMYGKDLFMYWPESYVMLTLSPKGDRLFNIFK